MVLLLEIMIYVAISLILDALAMELRSTAFGIMAIVVPLYEAAQLAKAGLITGSVVAAVGFNPTSNTFTNYTIDGNPFMLLLGIVTITSAVITMTVRASQDDESS